MFAPSTAIWGESEFCVGPVRGQDNFPGQNNQYSTSPPGLDRQKLQYHLSQLFPETIVAAVMQSHPTETDPQKLCQRILAFQNGFKE